MRACIDAIINSIEHHTALLLKSSPSLSLSLSLFLLENFGEATAPSVAAERSLLVCLTTVDDTSLAPERSSAIAAALTRSSCAAAATAVGVRVGVGEEEDDDDEEEEEEEED